MYISLQNICRNHRRIAAATKCKEKKILFSYDPDTQLDNEKRKMRRKRGCYSINTSLIVALMKRLTPVGLRVCFPSDHSLIIVAKNAFSQVSWKCGPY